MYLKLLSIKNFRAINELDLEFKNGVNILIGENNSGKTAVIDALRICLSHGKSWRDIFLTNKDFHIDSSLVTDEIPTIEFDLYFEITEEVERGYFNELISQDKQHPTRQSIQIHYRYFIEEGRNDRHMLKRNIWGGDNEGQQIPHEVLELLYYNHLDALRDATSRLRPYSRGSKVSELYDNLRKIIKIAPEGTESHVTLNKEKKKSLAHEIQSKLNDPASDWPDLVRTGIDKVNEHLQKASVIGKEPKVAIDFLPYEFENIIRSLLVRKPIYDISILGASPQKYFEIEQNGLGENNLIYTSVVLGDLKNRRDEGIEYYYALFIEEPEAHLHPQWQNSLFNYLNSLKNLKLQVFITSHSPTIASKSDLDNLIVLQKQNNKVSALPILNSELNSKNKKYLSKFLDVTKSQLFYSNGTIMVEGISEAILIPVFAKILGFDLDQHGVEVVNINGVSFEHFAKLYYSNNDKKRLAAKCAIITDCDKGQIKKNDFENETEGIDGGKSIIIYNALKKKGLVTRLKRISVLYEDSLIDGITDQQEIIDHRDFIKSEMSARKDRLGATANTLKRLERGNLKVLITANTQTFETEVLSGSKFNADLMRKVYQVIHPRTSLQEGDDLLSRSEEFINKLNQNKDKSELAQSLAFELDENFEAIKNNFVIPEYIKEAVNWALNR